jgi:hypothetical protein
MVHWTAIPHKGMYRYIRKKTQKVLIKEIHYVSI